MGVLCEILYVFVGLSLFFCDIVLKNMYICMLSGGKFRGVEERITFNRKFTL